MIPAGIFVEILIIGLLLLVATSPLLLAVWPRLRSQWHPGTIPNARAEVVVLILLLVYPVGVLGNRLSDDVFELLIDDTFLELKVLRGEWSKAKLQEEIAEGNLAGLERDERRKEIYKVAEARLLQKDGATRAWLERHKSFVRVLRGAAFSSLLFLLSAAVYKAIPRLPERYPWKLNLVVFVLFLAMFIAWRLETYGYQNRVVLLSLHGALQ